MKINTKSGISMIEILISIAIILIIFGISLATYYSSKKSSELNTTADSILFKLEQAKSSAMAGKYGLGSGVAFSSTTYTFFIGNSFTASSSNQLYEIPAGYSISVVPNGITNIIFSRLTGIPQTMATVTLSRTASSTIKKDIVIGNQGEIVIK